LAVEAGIKTTNDHAEPTQVKQKKEGQMIFWEKSGKIMKKGHWSYNYSH